MKDRATSRVSSRDMSLNSGMEKGAVESAERFAELLVKERSLQT